MAGKQQLGRSAYYQSMILFAAIVCLFALAIFVSYSIGRDILEDSFTESMHSLSVALSGNVAATLKSQEQKNLSAQEVMMRYGQLLHESNIYQKDSRIHRNVYQKLTAAMDEQLSCNPSMLCLALEDLNGNFYQRNAPKHANMPDIGIRIHEEINKNDEFLHSNMGKAVWTYFDDEAVLLMRAVFDESTMTFCGHVAAVVSIDKTKEVFSEVNNHKNGDFALLDPTGRVMYKTAEIPKEIQLSASTIQRTGSYYAQIYPTEYSNLHLLYFVNLHEKNERYFSLLEKCVMLLFVSLMIVFVFFRLTYFKSARSAGQILRRMNEIGNGCFTATAQNNLPKNEMVMIAKGLDQMAGRIELLVTQITKEEEAKRCSEQALLQTQYDLLRSQVNPHFLYNVLESIHGISILNDEPQIGEIACRLAEYYRASLVPLDTFSTIEQERDMLQNYVQLYQCIYPERLAVEWNIQDDCLSVRIPSLLLQPIVENAIVHGMENKPDICHISVSINMEEERIRAVISDDGNGISPEKIRELMTEENGHRVGLHNVRERLKMVYGADAELRIESEEKKYTRVILVFFRKPKPEFIQWAERG